jgi:hypothetical protein
VILSMLVLVSIGVFVADIHATTPSVNWSIVEHREIFNDGDFSDALMDLLLLDGNRRVELYDYSCSTIQGHSDIPCALKIRRNGSIEPFGQIGDGLNVINSKVTLDAVMDSNPGKVIVVDEVNFCEGPNRNDDLVGCGQLPGNTFVVEKDVQIDDFIHEYGHNKNRDHRDTCDKAIMHSQNIITDALIEEECVAMGGKKFTELSSSGGTSPLNSVDEPYWARTNIVVPTGQTLTIGSNVNIQFNKGVSIRGKVSANGRTGKIRLYSNCSGTTPCPRTYPFIP